MEHILSLSYGKDSLACLGAIEKLGLPLDRIVHAEVWATPEIPADLPEMVDFKNYADGVIYDRYGIAVEHYNAGITYSDMFYKTRGSRSKLSGSILGFPMVRGNWCLKLKLQAIKMAHENKLHVDYIGIALDEPQRFGVLNEYKRSPLVEIGWTENDCFQWCKDNNLLSPIYTNSARGGCWFCHNQSVDQLRLLRKQHPDYWDILLGWDLDSPVSFRPDGRSVADYDFRFRLEDAGIVPSDRSFRWSMIER